ncbi:MAG TPA: C-type lectin domain-containing protein [Kofleriaceae bacterium]|nr:C-type lectin domain-containing protein [Kofleriaceae bacterium]
MGVPRLICLLAIAALAGCDAHLGDGELSADAAAPNIDAPIAAPDSAAAVDAAPPPDAWPCVEGDDRIVGGTTGSCYFYVATPTTWLDAKAACEALGAHLVVSTSAGENTDFSALAGLLDVWAGGNDIAEEALWVWVTGELMGYTNWRSGEPNDYGTTGEDCMVIEGDNGGLWDDRPCASSYGYICERE